MGSEEASQQGDSGSEEEPKRNLGNGKHRSQISNSVGTLANGTGQKTEFQDLKIKSINDHAQTHKEKTINYGPNS